MELLEDAVQVLTPHEMKTLRRVSGWTLKTLSQRSGISVPQLSEYENGLNGLRRNQVETCERLLLDAARERYTIISKLLGPKLGRQCWGANASRETRAESAIN
jgi:transcriptional regulator with XRE-family HTH domain